MAKVTSIFTREAFGMKIDIVDFMDAVEVGEKFNTLENGDSISYVNVDDCRIAVDEWGDIYEEGSSYWAAINI